jgi:hypothetical protein
LGVVDVDVDVEAVDGDQVDDDDVDARGQATGVGLLKLSLSLSFSLRFSFDRSPFSGKGREGSSSCGPASPRPGGAARAVVAGGGDAGLLPTCAW